MPLSVVAGRMKFRNCRARTCVSRKTWTPKLCLQALTAAHLSGAISFETYFYNLSKGETYPDDVDMDTEKRLAKEGLEIPIPTNPAE